MSVSLTKGGNMSLTKAEPGLKKIKVGLGWDVRVGTGTAFDLDASAFILNDQGRVRTDADFIFYGNPASQTPANAVKSLGDNRTGQGDGDDETILIDLDALPADVAKVSIAITIYDAQARSQNFGMVNRAYARVLNEENDNELARYDLSEDYSVENALVFVEIYRHNGEWKVKALGQGFNGGLGEIAGNYGVNLS